MRIFCLLPVLIGSIAFASPVRIVDDRPGFWEAEWTSAGWRIETFPDGRVAFFEPAGSIATVPGDLRSSRLPLLLALPDQGDWRLSFPTDSGDVVAVGDVSRVPARDRNTGAETAVAAVDPPTTSVEPTEGFRLLRLDLPLSRLVAPGSVRLTRKLRIRVEWTGGARMRMGSVWKRIVDNPGGVSRLPSAAARNARKTESVMLGGLTGVMEIGDDDLFGSKEDGVVRLTGKAIAEALKIDIGGVSMADIAVYSGPSDTLRSVADSVVHPPELRLVPIVRRDLDRDGTLGPDDEIRFWGHGPNSWQPDSSSASGWSYTIHPYARKRGYLIRLDAPHGSPELESAKPISRATRFEDVLQPVNLGSPRLRRERVDGEEPQNDIGNGWFWFSSVNQNAFALVDSTGSRLEGIVGDSGWMKIRLARSGVLTGDTRAIRAVSTAGRAGWTRFPSSDPRQSVWSGGGLSESVPKFEVACGNDLLAIQDYQVAYRRDVSRSDSAWFPAPGLGAVEIRAKPGRICWAVENGIAVRACEVGDDGYLRDSVRIPGTWYALFPEPSAGIRPNLQPWTEPVGPHVVRDFSSPRSADVIVVCPRKFLGVAEEYATHREASFQVRPMKTAIVALEDLYDLWSGGMTDPVAIRDALQWTARVWGASHALLLGGGHADPRNVLGDSPESILPQWEDLDLETDDFFSGLRQSSSRSIKLALGRIPARSVDEARSWLEKVKIFEDPARAEFGPWRNRLVLAADDMKQGDKRDAIFDHTQQLERLWREIEVVRPWLRFEKIYMLQYPLSAQLYKPEATRDLKALLNQGVAGLLYMGHGGADILADEKLLNVADVDRDLENDQRPFLLFAGSCSVGRHDMPSSRGLSEKLVVSRGKGAFASVAATRPTYADANERFARNFWNSLLTGSRTQGEALLRSKEAGAPQAYNLLGDPAMVVLPGGLHVESDSVPDTIPALGRIRFGGRVDAVGGMQVRLEVESDLDTVDCDGNCTKSFQAFKPTSRQISPTVAPIEAGAFTSTVLFPARVPFGKRAAIATYAWDSTTRRDGGTVAHGKLFYGTAPTDGSDRQGPSIRVLPCDPSWSGGVAFAQNARVPLPFCLTVAVDDTSGISFEQGPDEGIVFGIPGVREAWHPDPQQGVDGRSASARLILDSSWLVPGESYPFDVTARDLMGNLSRKRVMLQPEIPGSLGLYEVFNSPNPVRAGQVTTFFFKLSADADTNGAVDSRAAAAIRIHSVSGKLIRVLRSELSNASHPSPQAVWDLRDSFGNQVANGLYPYSVVLRLPSPTGVGFVQREAKGIVAISR